MAGSTTQNRASGVRRRTGARYRRTVIEPLRQKAVASGQHHVRELRLLGEHDKEVQQRFERLLIVPSHQFVRLVYDDHRQRVARSTIGARLCREASERVQRCPQGAALGRRSDGQPDFGAIVGRGRIKGP